MDKDDQPMDLAVNMWRYKTDPKFRAASQQILATTDRMNKRKAAELLLSCEKFDPSEIYDYIEQNPPDAYVLVELIKLAQLGQRKRTAKAGGLKKNRENHAMKQDAFKWLDTNMKNFKSMDSAAEAITKHVVPVVFRTARSWVAEWKKLRSASRL